MAMPPLLSATWFPANERIISTAIACGLTSLGVSASFIIGQQTQNYLYIKTNSFHILSSEAKRSITLIH